MVPRRECASWRFAANAESRGAPSTKTVDILVQKHKDKNAAPRFFKKPLRTEGRSPNQLTTDKLPRCVAAKRELMPDVPHCTERYRNNRAEVSHENRMQNLFRLGRHLTRAATFRSLRERLFAAWRQVTCA